MKITRIAIIGTQIVTDESEVTAAAREALDWNGYQESDSPVEYEAIPDTDEDENIKSYSVFERWGSKSNRDHDNMDCVGTFPTEAEADAEAKKRNDGALADFSKAEWIELPQPVDFIYFGGCTQGNYPQTRVAEVTAHIGGDAIPERRITARGYGEVRFIRATHSHTALSNAVDNLIEKLRKPYEAEEDLDT